MLTSLVLLYPPLFRCSRQGYAHYVYLALFENSLRLWNAMVTPDRSPFKCNFFLSNFDNLSFVFLTASSPFTASKQLKLLKVILSPQIPLSQPSQHALWDKTPPFVWGITTLAYLLNFLLLKQIWLFAGGPGRGKNQEGSGQTRLGSKLYWHTIVLPINWPVIRILFSEA